jgi:UDP-glucuronate 4-epimerase
MRVLVTGAAGFIGSFTASRFLARGDEVVGLDNLNDYYDVTLKRARLARLEAQRQFRFVKLDLADQAGMAALFAREKFNRVVHLGAQAGVRHSMQDPHSYIASNVVGTLNVLEGCRHNGVDHLVYASTSSVYGASTKMPYSEHEPACHPLSLYGASKRATELMAHSYSSLFALPTTGLRFFTVYGPWGRPDMALFLFARAIISGKPIEVFNNGHHKRDFTYVEDVAEGIVRATDHVASANPQWRGDAPDPATSRVPYRLYNIGSNRPIDLLRYIEVLEQCLGAKAQCVMKPLQPGDVPDTWADVAELSEAVGYRPTTPIEVGVRNFVNWFREYYAT